jgi:Glycosyl transferase family 2
MSMSLNPSSGILFYSHNQAKYVVSGLNSIVAQEISGPAHLTIIDDASTDGTAEVIEEWIAKHRPMLSSRFVSVNFTHRKGQLARGQTATLLEGLTTLKTTYIYILEGDDEWILPSHINGIEEILEEYHWITACGSSWISLTDSNVIKGAFEKPEKLSFVQSLWDSQKLLGPNFQTLSAMGYRGDVVRRALPKLILCNEVADLGLNLFVSEEGPIYWCEQVSLKWRYIPHSAWRKIQPKEQIQRSISMLRDYSGHMSPELSAMLLEVASSRAKLISTRTKIRYALSHPIKACLIILRKLKMT